MAMRLQFLGATNTVTGSKYHVQSGRASLLVDCGLFQGFKQLRLRNWAPLPVDPRSLDAVVLTHAHIDHSGYLPLLVRNGFRGRIHCTESTYELCRILLPDSAWLQEEQAEQANRQGWSKHKPALPLYTRKDAEVALSRFAPVRFNEPFAPCPGIEARLTPAGHILGAAGVTLTAGEATLVFSGDLGRPNDAVMRAPQPIERADVLVLESTYGDRAHDATDGMAEMGRAISRTAARGGTVVIPSFAVGRAQSLLVYLHRLRAAHAISEAMPVYLDSPMATDVTALYVRFAAEHRLDAEEARALSHLAKVVASPDESRELDRSDWPKVIIAGSGMATGGRVLHHLERYAPDPRSLVMFAGFQAGGTRGEALVHGAREVKIHGAYVPVRCEVRNFDNLSAHADWRETVEWLWHFRAPPARTFLTHGEPAAADALRRHLREELAWEADVPDYLEAAVVSAMIGTAAAAPPALT
jgi:metallo-beta-lactamase family protein